MIGDYLNQSVTWKQLTAEDAYAGNTYSSSTISVRWEHDRRFVRSADGDQVVSEAAVFTTAAVSANDVLVDDLGREWPVITVARVPDLAGIESHREVRL